MTFAVMPSTKEPSSSLHLARAVSLPPLSADGEGGMAGAAVRSAPEQGGGDGKQGARAAATWPLAEGTLLVRLMGPTLDLQWRGRRWTLPALDGLRELVGVLVLQAGQSFERGRLAELLFPERRTAAALARLRRLLFELRRLGLPFGLVHIGRALVQWQPTVSWQTDEALVAQLERRDDVEADALADLARGVLLEGIEAPWLEARRRTIDEHMRALAERRVRLVGASAMVQGELFVGRDPERRAVADCWARTAREGPLCVAIDGASGVGKTRLLEEVARDLRRAGQRVVVSTCPSMTAPLELDVVATWLDQLDPQGLPHEVAEVIASVRAGRVTLGGSTSRRAVFQSLRRAVEGRLPLCVMIDGANGLDADSVDMIEYLLVSCAASVPPGRLLVIFAGRLSMLERRSPLSSLLSRLDLRGQLSRLSLEPLAPDDARQLATLMGTLEPAVTDAVVAGAEGNPALLVHLLRAASQGRLEDGFGAPLRARLEGLSSLEEALTVALARLGSASPRALAAAIGREPLDIMPHLTSLCRRGVMACPSDGPLTLGHRRLGAVALAELAPSLPG